MYRLRLKAWYLQNIVIWTLFALVLDHKAATSGTQRSHWKWIETLFLFPGSVPCSHLHLHCSLHSRHLVSYRVLYLQTQWTFSAFTGLMKAQTRKVKVVRGELSRVNEVYVPSLTRLMHSRQCDHSLEPWLNSTKWAGVQFICKEITKVMFPGGKAGQLVSHVLFTNGNNVEH